MSCVKDAKAKFRGWNTLLALGAMLLAGCSGSSSNVPGALELPHPTRLAGIALGDSEEDVRALYGDKVKANRFDGTVRSIFCSGPVAPHIVVWFSDTGPRVTKVQEVFGTAPWKVLQAAMEVYGEPDIMAPLGQLAIWKRDDAHLVFEASATPGDLVAGLKPGNGLRKSFEESVQLPALTLMPPGASTAAGIDDAVAAIRGPGEGSDK